MAKYRLDLELSNGNVVQAGEFEVPEAENSGVPIATTAGSGNAYTVQIPGITELYNGLLITIIPHVVSASATPTLNVNGLGAKGIRRHISTGNAGGTSAYTSSWLTASKPVLLEYNGTYWVAVGKEKPSAADLDGTVAVGKGGTGKTSFTANRLIYPSATTTLAQLSFPTVDKSVLRQNKSGAPYWSGMDTIAGEVSAAGVQLPIVTTTGTGAAYEATVPGITELKNGVCFIMIPHVVSASAIPTLNVNGLGAKDVSRRGSSYSYGGYNGRHTDWLGMNYPVLVMYSTAEDSWLVEGVAKPIAEDIEGTIPVNKGGTERNSWMANRIICATNQGKLGQIPNPTESSVLCQDTAGTPYWTAIDEIRGNLSDSFIIPDYYWRSRTINSTLNKTDVTGSCSNNLNPKVSGEYGDSVKIVYSEGVGEIVIENPTSFSGTMSSLLSTFNSIKGKYFKITEDNGMGFIINATYYTPLDFDDATATSTQVVVPGYGAGTVTGYIVYTQKVELNTIYGDWEITHSSNLNDYPQNGVLGDRQYIYLYSGTERLLKDNVKYGSYVGTGEDPVLIFDKLPKMIIISSGKVTTSGNNTYYEGIFSIASKDGGICIRIDGSSTSKIKSFSVHVVIDELNNKITLKAGRGIEIASSTTSHSATSTSELCNKNYNYNYIVFFDS